MSKARCLDIFLIRFFLFPIVILDQFSVQSSQDAGPLSTGYLLRVITLRQPLAAWRQKKQEIFKTQKVATKHTTLGDVQELSQYDP